MAVNGLLSAESVNEYKTKSSCSFLNNNRKFMNFIPSDRNHTFPAQQDEVRL